jgi:LysM repeat protein
MLYPDFKQCLTYKEKEDSQYTENNYYIAQTGDTLYTISRFYNISLDYLIEANPDINPELITPGQTLCIPKVTPPVSCPAGAATYIVKNGDTIYSIAKDYKMRLSPLLKANPNVNPDALLVGQSICIPMISSTYTNSHYRIRLIYPYRWSRIDNMRYEGIDGFFQVSAISGDASINELCSNEAHHRHKPYGTKPIINEAVVSGREACFIVPSSDQPMEMRGQSALIVKYDKSVEIEDISYKYLIIWTDKNHLKEISNTLEFLDE